MQRRFPQRLNLAAGRGVRRLNRDGAVHAGLPEDALTLLFASCRKRLVVIVILPPWPCAAWARIWLFCRMTYCGSIVHAAAAARAIEDRGADRAIGELNRTAR